MKDNAPVEGSPRPDHIDLVRERAELVKLSKINPKKYIEEFRRWCIERIERLADESWRKAYEKKSED